MNDFARRYTPGTLDVGTRDGEATGPAIIEGYAARFNSTSEILPGNLRERIIPGAFRSILQSKPKVVALYQHNMSDPAAMLGSTESNLTLREDSNGLHYSLELDAADSRIARMVERGDISQSSFAFRWAEPVRLEFPKDGIPVRIIEEVTALADVSLVLFPAYQATSAAARAQELEMNLRSLEGWRESHPPWKRNAADRAMHLRNLK